MDIQSFKVLKNVPLPSWGSGGGKKYDWPFGKMKVGECFFVPLQKNEPVGGFRTRSAILRGASLWRVTGRRFATRLSDDDKHIGVWRIA